MKLASIFPVANIEKTFNQSFAMMLAHLKEYYPECENNNCYKIMDNSLIELGGAVNIETVIEAARSCSADEIILPDVFKDGEATMALATDTLEYLRTNGLLHEFKLMAVCQGKDKEEFEKCFSFLNNLPEIHCIGIPKVMNTIIPGGRPALEYLWERGKTSKCIHLLGCWTSLKEIFEYKNPQLIRSIDTCIPALLSKTTADPFMDRPLKTIDLINDKIREDNYEQMVYHFKNLNLI